MLETALFPLFVLCQAPTVALASSSSDTRTALDPAVLDEEWIRRADSAPGCALYLDQRAQMALMGDLDGDGMFEAPDDIDALCWMPRAGSTAPAVFDVAFSLLAGVGGYDDGDLLRIREDGGVEVVAAEADFLAALQPGSGGFDLDAAEWQPPDQIWFSTEGSLTGTVVGDVDDGDVLMLDRTTGTVQKIYTEAQMQAFVEHAIPGSPAIGDVLSLAFYPPTGELAFTVQSPSAQDSTVFGTGNGGQLLAGWAETDWAFQQETELDALAFIPGSLPAAPVLTCDLAQYAPGAPVSYSLSHGTPGSVALTYIAAGTSYMPQVGQGVGFFYLDRSDAFLNRQVSHGHTRPVVFDPAGNAALIWTAPVPKAGTVLDLYLQSYDTTAAAWTAPIVLRVQ